MKTISFVAILLSIFFRAPSSHFFTGMVREVRQVVILGMSADVIKVQADGGFEAWVIQRIDTGAHDGQIVLGEAQVGDYVKVSLHGQHVGPNGVDWSKCQPANQAYCWFGSLYDNGPISLENGLPLSPSNEFIQHGHPNPHYSEALFWHTQVLEPAAGKTIRRPYYVHQSTIGDWFPGSFRGVAVRLLREIGDLR